MSASHNPGKPATRREFLRKSAVLGTGASIAGCSSPPLAGGELLQDAPEPSPAAPANPRPIKRALKLGMLQIEGSLEARLEVAAELGWDGVEPDAPSNFDREELLRAARNTGLAIPGVVDSAHWVANLADPDASVRDGGREALLRAMDDAAFYGASTVLLVPAVVSPRVPYDAAWDRSRAEIEKVLPRAEELGVKIAIENVWNHFLLSPLEAARYVDSFESDHIGWFLDVGNLVNYGWPAQWARILGRRVLKLDVKGFSRQKRDAEGLWQGFNVPIGEGDGDWSAVMAELDACGFTAGEQGAPWASAEVAGGDAAHLTEVLARMDQVLGA